MLADDILEPWGENRGDIHAAQVTSAIYNAARTRRSQKSYGIEDMLVKWNIEQTAEASDADKHKGNALLFAKLSKYATNVEA